MTTFLLSLVLWMATAPAFAIGLYSPTEAWNGEYMQSGQGAAYVRFQLEGFKTTRSGVTTDVFMNVTNTANGKRLVIHQPAAAGKLDEVQVWKMPQGRYRVDSLTINEPSGITRKWVNNRMPTFLVRPMFLSNIGEVSLKPFSTQGLKVSFRTLGNRFVNPHSHQAFAGVIEAYSGKMQTKLGGANLVKNAQDDFSSAMEARSAFSMMRQISMVYRLDSTGSQGNRSLIAKTIDAQDSDLRQCYMDQLDLQTGLRGSVSFQLQISPRNRSFDTLKYSGGDLRSMKTVDCMNLTLRRMQFPVSSRLMGRLIFQFDYKEDQGRVRFP